MQLEDIGKWRKEIELIGIDIRGIEEDIETTNRLKLITTFMNSHFISELDRNRSAAHKYSRDFWT